MKSYRNNPRGQSGSQVEEFGPGVPTPDMGMGNAARQEQLRSYQQLSPDSDGAADVRTASSPVPPAANAPGNWGTPLAEHRGVVAYSNGGDVEYWQESEFGYAWQCVEFVRRYLAEIGGYQLPLGNANTNIKRPIGGLSWVPNDGHQATLPADGDVLVFSGGSVGHIAIATGGGPSGIGLIHQNWSANSATASLAVVEHLGTYEVRGLSGYTLAGWHTDGQPAEGLRRSWSRQSFVFQLAQALGLDVESPEEAWGRALAERLVHDDDPDGPILRGAATEMVARAKGLRPPPGAVGATDSRFSLPFADVREGDWYADSAALCRMAGLVRGFGDNSFQGLSELTETDADALLGRLVGSESRQLTLQEQAEHLPEALRPMQSDQRLDTDHSTEQVSMLGSSQLYAHGGFMGAAGSMVSDPRWMAILKEVDSALYDKVTNKGSTKAIMGLLENSAVLAAYGTCLSQGLAWNGGDMKPSGRPVPLEWDVWLSPTEPQNMDKARIVHGGTGELSRSRWELQQILAGDLQPEDTYAFYFDEVHEGTRASDWVQQFGQAATLWAYGGTRQPSGAAQHIQDLLQVGLYLDVKSPSTGEQIQSFIDALEERHGITVLGVGSFNPGQLDGLDADTQGVVFFAELDELEEALKAGEVGTDHHQTVMFNIGDLYDTALDDDIYQFWARDWGDGVPGIDIVQGKHDRLVTIRENWPELQIGGYVQETRLSPQVARTLSAYVNGMGAPLINLGFAYGNLDGHAEGSTSGRGEGLQALQEEGEMLSDLWFPPEVEWSAIIRKYEEDRVLQPASVDHREQRERRV